MHKLDNLYEGMPIFVLSTGTSLRGFDFARLNGRITIGINRVIEYYHPSILHFVDITAHHTHEKALRDYNGMILGCRGAVPLHSHDNAFEVEHTIGTFELGPDTTLLNPPVGRSFSDGLFGSGAGATALHAAILLGGDPIYLLGYDYYECNGSHFDEWDEARNDREIYPGSFRSIEHMGREKWLPAIYNCNPRSRLTCFPCIDLEAVLADEPAGGRAIA